MLGPSLASEGNRLLSAGKLADAIRSFEAALKTDPNDARCLLGLAKAQIAAADEDAALATLERLIALRSDHLEAHSHHGLLLARRGDPRGPAEMEAVARDRRAGFEEHLNFGRFLLAVDQDERAMKEFEACARIEGRDIRPHMEMGQIALRRNDAAAAVNHLLKATQLASPMDVVPLLLLARAYRGAHQDAQAAAVYMEVLQRRPDDHGLYDEAYACCFDAMEFDTALKVVLLARERTPNEPRYAQWQSDVMAKIKSGAGKKASKHYEEADAGAIDVTKQLARAKELLGRNPPTPPHVAQEVSGILDQVLRLQPEHGEALALMGLCAFLVGKWDECEEYGKKAQAAGERAKNKGWKETGDFLLANLERKRNEKKSASKALRASGLKRAPTGVKRAAVKKKGTSKR